MPGHGGDDDQTQQQKKDSKSKFAANLSKLYEQNKFGEFNLHKPSGTRTRTDSKITAQASAAAAAAAAAEKLSKQFEKGRHRAASAASSVTSRANTRLKSLRDFIEDKLEGAKSVVVKARLPRKEHETDMQQEKNMIIDTVLIDLILCIREYHARLEEFSAVIEDRPKTPLSARLSLLMPEQLLEISQLIISKDDIKSPLTDEEEAKFYEFCDLVYERMIKVNIPFNQVNINAVSSVYMPEFLMLVSSIIEARLPLVEEQKIIPPITMPLTPMASLKEKREPSSSSEEHEADSGKPRPPPPPIPQPNINKLPPIPPRPKGKGTNI